MNNVRYVGLDVHKDSVVMSVAEAEIGDAERTAPHQLSKFLLRHDRAYRAGREWTLKHMTWVRQQTLTIPAASACRQGPSASRFRENV
ncbi:MAG: hypothetical protein KDA89_16400 [Planctomycetaceae bacterium]|nr:hypothetical protein [Planctomycetaceae bacterium]